MQGTTAGNKKRSYTFREDAILEKIGPNIDNISRALLKELTW